MRNESELFKTCSWLIRREYKENEKKYKWSYHFLYGPKETLGCKNGILLIGFNPGGCAKRKQLEEKNGNSHLLYLWKHGRTERCKNCVSSCLIEKKTGERIILQKRICELFQGIANAANKNGKGQAILKETLTSNFIPFRSPSSDKLINKKKAVAFAYMLWQVIARTIQPKVVLCIGKGTCNYMKNVYTKCGWGVKSNKLKGKWKKAACFSATKMKKHILIVGLPHLSRSKIGPSDKMRPLYKIIAKQAALGKRGRMKPK